MAASSPNRNSRFKTTFVNSKFTVIACMSVGLTLPGLTEPAYRIEMDSSRHYIGVDAKGETWDWSITETTTQANGLGRGGRYDGTTISLGRLSLKYILRSGKAGVIEVQALEWPGIALLVRPTQPGEMAPMLARAVGD